jgi:heme exporter protein B
MSAAMALFGRDVRLALRQAGGTGTAIGFFLTFVVLLPVGLGPDQALLGRIAPGALWIALLLSVLLSADRIFESDHADGSLEILAMSGTPLPLLGLAKAAAHWVTAALPLAIAAPILGFLVNLDPALIVPQLLAMLIGSLALSLLALLGAAITIGLRRGGPLVSLLILPLYVPVLIFGVAASSAGESAGSARLVLLALSLISLVLCPAAAAAAIRAHLR